jgi:Rod binding domain-containing protein
MFLDYLMETMRKTVGEHPLDLDNHASRMYRSMLDSESAKTAARTGGIGIADLIIAYMAPPQYTVTGGNDSHPGGAPGAARARTGGTDESR